MLLLDVDCLILHFARQWNSLRYTYMPIHHTKEYSKFHIIQFYLFLIGNYASSNAKTY